MNKQKWTDQIDKSGKFGLTVFVTCSTAHHSKAAKTSLHERNTTLFMNMMKVCCYPLKLLVSALMNF